MKSNLTFKTVPRPQLLPDQKDRMFDLMAANYAAMTREIFLRDLHTKQIVCLILDEEQQIQGFTTFAINPKGSGTDSYHVLFSGDTIISPEHWGSMVMVKGWCATVGSIIATDTSKTWYWYLMSKGHRTYMYLPLFFHSYYPSVEETEEAPRLRTIIDEVSSILYPHNWKSTAGVIQFDSAAGSLAPELLEGTYSRKNNAHVALFLERNPGFYRGDELVCMARLAPDNFKRSAKDYILQGMNCSIPIL